MKKLLLIAAMAAVALGASAGYTLEKVWEISDVSFLPVGDTRQGFGMDGKFYINNKADQVVYIIDENGLTEETLPGGRNCAITRDEAGNIITSDAGFGSTMWVDQSFTVRNPTTGESATYMIPNDTGFQGRCDFFGFAKGDLLEDGELYITAANTDGTIYTDKVLRIKITESELDTDNTYVATCDGLVNPQSSTVINYYIDLQGEEALIYAYRSGNPAKLVADGDNYTFTSIVLPNLDEVNKKGHANGIFPLIWDGKEMFIYPLMPDYRDGWAIAEAGAAEPLLAVTSTAQANPNAFQANWLNAEVDDTGVTIYQYMPGYCLRVYRLTKDEPSVPHVYMLGGDSQEWNPTQGQEIDYDAENDVYTATITFPDEYNFFGFTTELAENNDDGGWRYIEPFRFGAIADEGTDFLYEGQEYVSLTWDEYHAIGIKGGEYKLTINLNEMRLYIEDLNPQGIRGDVNMDGFVKIDDVTALIDYLLSGNEEGIDINAADCNKSGDVKIDDVTTLIDYLLGGNWPN